MAKDDTKPVAKAEERAAEPAEPEAPKYDPSSATPEEHARALGELLRQEREPIRINGRKPGPLFSWRHAAAAQLHGWNHHVLHDAEPLKITQDAYKAALQAVEAPVAHVVAKDGKRRVHDAKAKLELKAGEHVVHDYAPHEAAVSKHFKPTPKEQ